MQADAALAVDLAIGDYITTTASVNAPGSTYLVVDVIDTVAVLDRAWMFPTETFAPIDVGITDEPTLAAGELGIRFKGRDEIVTFEVSIAEDLGLADITETATWLQGSGAAWQVASMEDETQVFDGYGTSNEAWPVDFGEPTDFVTDSSLDQYALYFVTVERTIIPSAGAPQNQTKMRSYLIFGAIEGSQLEIDLDALFPPL